MSTLFSIPQSFGAPAAGGASTVQAGSFLANAARTPPPALQPNTLRPEQIQRVAAQLGVGKDDRASFTFSAMSLPQSDVTGGVLVDDGQVKAIVNTARLPEQAKLFGLDLQRLGDAIAEQEVTQKIVQSDPRFARVSKTDEEILGERAMLQSYPATALRTLARSGQQLTGGGDPEYAGIAKVTAEAMGAALSSVERGSGAPQMSGRDAVIAFDRFVESNVTRYSDYRTAFRDFAKDVLKVSNPDAFMGVFERSMTSAFDRAGRAILERAR